MSRFISCLRQGLIFGATKYAADLRPMAAITLQRPSSHVINYSSNGLKSIHISSRLRNLDQATSSDSEETTGQVSSIWPEAIRKFLEQEKIVKATSIQEKTLPIAMDNKNLVAIARTGSGKTLAFVIPAVMKVLQAREEGGVDSMSNHGNNFSRPTCLVLAPTRELATQTASVFDRFHRFGIRTISLVGGSSRSDQLRQLQRGNHDVLVATPGRLIDLVESEQVDLSGIKYLVLDEADRMLDMGFEPQIRRILMDVPKDKQTSMWSATWPQEIQALANEFLVDYEYIAVDSEKLKANPNIKQVVEICEPNEKLRKLVSNLEQFREELGRDPRVLIFVNTKRLAEGLITNLMRHRIKAIAIHGDRSQNQRDNALRMFRDRMCHVMVATDVAARGLDISDITHVVNFDFPNTIEDYIHRIGRTARHEREGKAVSLFTVNDGSLASRLVQVLRETNQEVPAGLAEMQSYGKSRSFSRGGNRDRYGGGYGGGGGGGYGGRSYGGRGDDMYQRRDDRNDFGYKRSNDRFNYDRQGSNSRGRYNLKDDSDFENESPYERNDRYDRSGPRARHSRGSVFDD